MKQNTFSILRMLLLALILSPFIVIQSSAYDFEVDGICYNITSYIDNEIYKGTVGVTYRGDDANSIKNTYSGDVIIPSSVTYGGDTYFVNSIGASAFQNCTGLTSVSLPNIESIEGGAFIGCTGLTSITLPDYVNRIGTFAFASTGLTSITLPEWLMEIEQGAFAFCYSLTSVTLGKRVERIGPSIFMLCSSLTDITSQATTPAKVYSVDFFGEDDDSYKQKCTLHVPQGTASAYQNAEGWNYFSQIVEDAVPGSTAVEGTSAEDEAPKAIYNIFGRKLSAPQRGINIINNKKVFVK